MTLQRLEGNEPTIQALVEAVKTWQHALDITLSTAGLSYPKWILLQGIAHGDYVRGQPYAGAILIDPDIGEHLLTELHRDGWIAFPGASPCRADGANACSAAVTTNIMPRIPHDQFLRLNRVAQSLRALHSVSLSTLTGEERIALAALLKRMQAPLQAHTARLQQPARNAIRTRDPGNGERPSDAAMPPCCDAALPEMPAGSTRASLLNRQAPRVRTRHRATLGWRS